MSYLDHIKFLYKSNNQHGVHSPFVYNLVTECFYDKKNYKAYQILQNIAKRRHIDFQKVALLFRLERYLQFGQALLQQSKDKDGIEEVLHQSNTKPQCSDLHCPPNSLITADFVYLDAHQQSGQKDFDSALSFIGNNSCVFVDHINRSVQSRQTWDFLKAHPTVQITIDTFKFGFLFFRQEQAKQDFFIRL